MTQKLRLCRFGPESEPGVAKLHGLSGRSGIVDRQGFRMSSETDTIYHKSRLIYVVSNIPWTLCPGAQLALVWLKSRPGNESSTNCVAKFNDQGHVTSSLLKNTLPVRLQQALLTRRSRTCAQSRGTACPNLRRGRRIAASDCKAAKKRTRWLPIAEGSPGLLNQAKLNRFDGGLVFGKGFTRPSVLINSWDKEQITDKLAVDINPKCKQVTKVQAKHQGSGELNILCKPRLLMCEVMFFDVHVVNLVNV